MPRWPDKDSDTEVVRFIAPKAGPIRLVDGKHVEDKTEPSGIGGPDGHFHVVQEAGEGKNRIRFITCAPCAQAAGWPREGSPETVPASQVPLSMAVDQ